MSKGDRRHIRTKFRSVFFNGMPATGRIMQHLASCKAKSLTIDITVAYINIWWDKRTSGISKVIYVSTSHTTIYS
jgi:hypothetical protein